MNGQESSSDLKIKGKPQTWEIVHTHPFKDKRGSLALSYMQCGNGGMLRVSMEVRGIIAETIVEMPNLPSSTLEGLNIKSEDPDFWRTIMSASSESSGQETATLGALLKDSGYDRGVLVVVYTLKRSVLTLSAAYSDCCALQKNEEDDGETYSIVEQSDVEDEFDN